MKTLIVGWGIAMTRTHRRPMNARVIASFGVISLLVTMVRGQPLPNPRLASPEFRFEDITKSAGINFRLLSGSEPITYIPEAMSGGIAFVDYDNDGWIDIYLVNGSTVEMERKGGNRNANRLYRNNRDKTFTDVTSRSGTGGHHWGMGVCAGDVNNDGFDDLYVTNMGPNILYLNRGDGTFADFTRESGTGNPRWSSSCAFGDYDKDGDLDLYVSNYVDFDVQHPPEEGNDGTPCSYQGISAFCGPVGLKPAPDVFYENRGDGRFLDATARAGLDRVKPSYGMSAVWFDMEGDGDLDIFVANDNTPNFLFRNNGDSTFTDVALTAGAALSFSGQVQAGMGVDAGDYDDDGDFDLIVTTFSNDYDSLFKNDGKGYFSDGSTPGGLVAATVPYVAWGVQFADLDLDGRQDLPIVNGHVYSDQVHSAGRLRLHQSAGYRQHNLLLWNRGDNRFVDASKDRPRVTGFEEKRLGRGLAAGDINNDGRIDLLISSLGVSPRLLMNQTPTAGNWLLVKLIGRKSGRSAIGAVVVSKTADRTQSRLVKSGGSYQSQSDLRPHFGLGAATSVDQLTVRWPSGKTTVHKDIRANQILTLTEE